MIWSFWTIYRGAISDCQSVPTDKAKWNTAYHSLECLYDCTTWAKERHHVVLEQLRCYDKASYILQSLLCMLALNIFER